MSAVQCVAFFNLLAGIFGYLNYLIPRSRQYILETLVKGLQRLEYRGYDSAGVAFDGDCNVSVKGESVSKTRYAQWHLWLKFKLNQQPQPVSDISVVYFICRLVKKRGKVASLNETLFCELQHCGESANTGLTTGLLKCTNFFIAVAGSAVG